VLIALTSAKGSPGVTTAGLALALSWQQRVILAELDPAGGEVLAGYGRAQLKVGGLGELVFAARRGGLEQHLFAHLVRLDEAGKALLLPGLDDPGAAHGIDWTRLAAALAGLDEQGTDVLADCGRLRAGLFPTAVLQRADAVVLVTDSTLRAVHPAKLAIADLRRLFSKIPASGGSLCALVVAPGEPYTAREVGAALGVPVVGVLPRDRKAAPVLSDGVPAGRSFSQSVLLRAARTAAADLAGFAGARHSRLTPALASTLAVRPVSANGTGRSHGR
jgi:MinD-like ATPase involved in chromosome partitioning or flagellar assembly